MRVCVRAHACVPMYTDVCAHLCMHASMYMDVCVHVCLYIHVCECVCVHVCLHIDGHGCVCMHTSIDMDVCVSASGDSLRTKTRRALCPKHSELRNREMVHNLFSETLGARSFRIQNVLGF